MIASTEATAEIAISKIKIGERHRKDMGDLGELAKSIEEMGLLQPIGLTPKNELIFGERRIRATELLGRKSIAYRVVNVPSIVAGEYAENEVRKEFTTSERVAIAKAVAEEMGERRGRPEKSDTIVPLKNEDAGKRTSEIAAEKAGFSNREEFRRAATVVARGTPELIKAMDTGAVSVSTAAKLAEMPKAEQKVAAKEAMEGNKKAAIQAAKPKVDYPLSTWAWDWANDVSGFFQVVKQDHGGKLDVMFCDKRWDKKETAPFVVMLKALKDSLVKHLKDLED